VRSRKRRLWEGKKRDKIEKVRPAIRVTLSPHMCTQPENKISKGRPIQKYAPGDTL